MAKREEKSVVYGCFRCGSMITAPDDLIRPLSCGDCGSIYLLTHQEALDTLNNLYISEKFKPAIQIDVTFDMDAE